MARSIGSRTNAAISIEQEITMRTTFKLIVLGSAKALTQAGDVQLVPEDMTGKLYAGG